MEQKNLNIDHVYKHEKTLGMYRPLFLNFKNNKEKLVYIDNKGGVWCKDKSRFLKGMKFEKECGEDISYELSDLPSAFYVNKNSFMHKELNKSGEIICVANDKASDSKDYPLMVVVLIEGEHYLHTWKEFENLYLK